MDRAELTLEHVLTRHQPTRISRSLLLLVAMIVETVVMMKTLMEMSPSSSTQPSKITPSDRHVMLVHAILIASTVVKVGQLETSIETSQLIKDVDVVQEKFNSFMGMNVKQKLVAQIAQSADRAGL